MVMLRAEIHEAEGRRFGHPLQQSLAFHGGSFDESHGPVGTVKSFDARLRVEPLRGVRVSARPVSPAPVLCTSKAQPIDERADGACDAVEHPSETPMASFSRLTLEVKSQADLRPLADLTDLRHLRLAVGDGLGASVDLSTLAEAQGLESLALDLSCIPDLSPLASLVWLREVVLRGSLGGPVDLEPLSGLDELRVFTLNDAMPRSLAPLAVAGGIRTLDLRGCSIDDLSPLLRFDGLETLLLGEADVVNFSLIAEMSSLRAVELPSTLNESVVEKLRAALPEARIWVHDASRRAA